MKQLRSFVSQLQKGLTITEMLLYMAIFAILLTVLMQIFFSALDSQLESKSTSSVDQDGSYILARLSYDIGQATSVATPSAYGIATNSLQITTNGSLNTYALNGAKNMTLTNLQGSNVMNTPDTTVSNLSFIRLGNLGGKSTIQINFQIESVTKRRAGAETRTYTTTVGLR